MWVFASGAAPDTAQARTTTTGAEARQRAHPATGDVALEAFARQYKKCDLVFMQLSGARKMLAQAQNGEPLGGYYTEEIMKPEVVRLNMQFARCMDNAAQLVGQ